MSIQDYIVTCFEYIFVLLQVLVEHGQSRKIVTVLENEKLAFPSSPWGGDFVILYLPLTQGDLVWFDFVI